MKGFFRFLFSGRVWKNILLIGVFFALLLWGITIWLSAYTRHGKSIEVPDLTGFPIDKLETVLGNYDLVYEVTDSIYSDVGTRGTVVSQNPPAGKQVKKGRTIFLTVNSLLPEMVQMPDLVGRSKRIALPLIEIAGLRVEALEYKPDEACTDCVLEQLYQGRPIKPGDQIRKGEAIKLVLGQESNVRTVVPRVLGLAFNSAAETLNAYSLNTGEIMSCQGCRTASDTAGAFVVNQIPAPDAEVRMGTYVELYLTTDSAKAREFRPESRTPETEAEETIETP